MYALLDSSGGGVHRNPLWAPRSWTRAPTVPHVQKALEAGGIGEARVYKRRAHSGLMDPLLPGHSQAYIGRNTYHPLNASIKLKTEM